MLLYKNDVFHSNGPFNLPMFCYSVLPDTGDLVIIEYGKAGYLLSDYNSDCTEENKKLASLLNDKYGITVNEESGMVFGSVFGWDCPGCNPALYKNGRMLCFFKKEKIQCLIKVLKTSIKTSL